MSIPLRILSVAPRYRPGVDGAQGGHYTVYQDDLRAGAARLGLSLLVLADRTAAVAEGASTVLDTTDERTIAASVASVLRPDDLVMVYEGSLAMVEAFVPVAGDRPDVRFVVNLFRPEPGLVPARTSRGRARPEDHVAVDTLSDGVPDNLVISAETESRVEFARRLGIPCAGAWRLHSTLWDVESDPAGHVRPDGSALRVLVPLADRGHSEDVVRDVATVLHLLRNYPGAGVSITFTGAGSTKFSAQVRGPRLEALGARRIVSPADRSAYAALFAAHDVIWIPNRHFYRSQSSGKSLDALVVGRPVMASEGSWPASESSRWAGEALSYRDAHGAAGLLLDLRGRIHDLHDRLAHGSERIRAAYAPESTVLRVLELAAHGARPADGAPAHAAPEKLPPFAAAGEHRAGSPGSPHLFPTGQRLRASVAARRAARIGWSARVQRQLRRRLPPLLTSVSGRLRAAGER